MTLEQIRARANAAHGCTCDPCGSPICQTQRDRARLLAALDAVLAPHQPDGGHNPLCHCGIKPGNDPRCRECYGSWPCQAVRTVTEALEADQ